jgi:hypothetical protein
MAPGDAGADADALRRAMKGFGTDEAVLIRILAKPDPMQMALLRHSYSHHLGRDLEKDVASETSGYLEEGLVALIRGPLMNDVHNLRKSMKGPGTNEVVMNDVLLSRSNADMAAIKKAYYDTYHHDVSVDVKGDLSMKTERHFSMVLAANRAEESAPVYPQSTEQDVSELYKATAEVPQSPRKSHREGVFRTHGKCATHATSGWSGQGHAGCYAPRRYDEWDGYQRLAAHPTRGEIALGSPTHGSSQEGIQASFP